MGGDGCGNGTGEAAPLTTGGKRGRSYAEVAAPASGKTAVSVLCPLAPVSSGRNGGHMLGVERQAEGCKGLEHRELEKNGCRM